MLDVLDELMTKDEEEVESEVTLKLNREDLTLTWMLQQREPHPQVSPGVNSNHPEMKNEDLDTCDHCSLFGGRIEVTSKFDWPLDVRLLALRLFVS